MAELVIGQVIPALVETLASSTTLASGDVVFSAKIRSKLRKWSGTLTIIQAVLVDAGQKQARDRSVEVWLNKLQHLAYEIDDVLDDFITEATRHRLNQQSRTSTSKVIKFIPDKLHTLRYDLKMSSKLDEITTKLFDLVEEKQLLGLTDNVETAVRASGWVEETSYVDKSTVIGREGDKNALLEMLLGVESSNSQAQKKFNVVSIVGMGGIGKTTLAQLLFNNEKVKAHFELRSWVCVSNDFDVFTINKTIYKDVGGDDSKIDSLNHLQVALSEKLSRRRFLLVLDDVWSENIDDWETLQRPYNVGGVGSKILVTTRKANVASVMDSVQAYPLKLLSDEEALSLFAQHASSRQDYQVNRILKLYGEDIIKKCGRLPLALKTLGRVFRDKHNVEEWEDLLNSDIWNSIKETSILPVLKLSYYDLPPHLKRMFVYCCLFPKGYMFDKDELVLLWMAEGFLYESINNKSLESFGQACFEELLSRSLFQHITGDNSYYTMHGLINDLATSVAGEFFLMLDDKMDVYNKIEASEKIHHLSFISEEKGADKKFKELKQCKHLRTLLAMPVTSLTTRDRFDVSINVLIEPIPQLQFVRVLSLASYNITKLPKFICSLKHLRYLNFSNTEIACLPEQVCDLHNLQSLLVSGCYKLSSLPKSTVKLINLRHLDISHTPGLNKMLLGIVGLMWLQNLSKIVIGEDDVFHLSDLKSLLHLHGKLSIKGLHKVINEVQAKEANLQQMKGICDLHLEWSDEFDDSRNKATEYEVLEWLRPYEKLRSLKILYYGGIEFPSWVGDPSFICLTNLTLWGCKSCKCLPALGHLPSLRELVVEGMDVLERLDFEFLWRLKSYQAVEFPSLEVLKFKDIKNWEEWAISGSDMAVVFPCLREIHMIDFEKLCAVAIELLPSLQVLNVEGCSLKKLEVFKCNNLESLGEKRLQSVTEVEIRNCERLETYNCPSSIERLRISDCKSLTSLSFPTMDDLPSTLKCLDIAGCDSLEVSWPDNNFLSSLEHLFIFNFPNLRLFPEGCFVHLTELEITGCGNIESIPDNGYGFLPSRCLKSLEIRDCKNLRSFPYKHLQSLASLEELLIRECPSLDYSFPCGLWPPNLIELHIGGLKKPIAQWGFQNFPPSLVTLMLDGRGKDLSGVVSLKNNSSTSSFLLPSSLTRLEIYDFKELESVTEGLQHLTSLQHLYIDKCPKLRDLPETLLPSLSTLSLFGGVSLELEKKCIRKGKYWPIISQIPDFGIEIE